jgi:hypothetical protein
MAARIGLHRMIPVPNRRRDKAELEVNLPALAPEISDNGPERLTQF